jgi:hypothetical protein
MRVNPVRLGALLLSATAAACGPGPAESALAIHVERQVDPRRPGSARGFDPLNPPVWVRVRLARASAPQAPFVALETAWDALPRDAVTGRRILELGVPPNQGRQDAYLLQLASVVLDPDERRLVDECGITGGIETAEGQRARVRVVTHPGECGIPCARDADCPGQSRYCLGFECQEGRACALDGDCPAGARCTPEGSCTARCGPGLPACPDGFACCGSICAPACGAEP